MLRIMTHIERLLLVHDCVIIPGVGGFVLQNEPASFLVKEGSFVPQRKEVVFNRTLQHNDGLLTESYMRMYRVDFRNALVMQEEDTESLRMALASKHRMELGAMGTFLVKDGVVLFEPGEAAPFSVSSYGLAPFHIPTLQTLREEQDASMLFVDKASKQDTIYIPVSRTFIRVVVASAAAIGLFLLLSTPVTDVNTAAYTASFIPTEVVSRVESIQPEVVTSTEEMITAVPVQNAAVGLSVPEVKKEVTASLSITNQKMFHIIIASFPTKVQATDFISTVDTNQYTGAGMVERNSKARVYAARFTNRTEAETYLSTLKAGNKYNDAWLFISR